MEITRPLLDDRRLGVCVRREPQIIKNYRDETHILFLVRNPSGSLPFVTAQASLGAGKITARRGGDSSTPSTLMEKVSIEEIGLNPLLWGVARHLYQTWATSEDGSWGCHYYSDPPSNDLAFAEIYLYIPRLSALPQITEDMLANEIRLYLDKVDEANAA